MHGFFSSFQCIICFSAAAVYKFGVSLQVAGLRPMSASDEEEAEEGHSDTASSADEDIDDLDDDSDASTGESEGGEDEGTAGVIPGSTDRNPAAVKKQKAGAETNGLGSVGWDASDEEEDQAVPAPTGNTSSSNRSLHTSAFDVALGF